MAAENITQEQFIDYVKANPDIYYCRECRYYVKIDETWLGCNANILKTMTGKLYKGVYPIDHTRISSLGKNNDVYIEMFGYALHLMTQENSIQGLQISTHYMYKLEFDTKELNFRKDIFHITTTIPPVCIMKSYPIVPNIKQDGLFLESYGDMVHLRVEKYDSLEIVWWRFDVGYQGVRITQVPSKGIFVGK